MESNRKLFGAFWIIFFFTFFKSIYSSRLRNPTLCGSLTCDASKKFNYSLNTQYVYSYDVDVSTLFQGTSENKSTLHVKAQANLNFIAPCQGVLRLSNILLTDGYDGDEDADGAPLPKADQFAEAISKKELRFSFRDGAIEELCPDKEESVWVLNFKRGVLSAFHNTMKRFDIDDENKEVDVNGECRTKYQLRGANRTQLVISKSKNLNVCLKRFQYHTITQSTPYNFGSDFKTIPLVKSSHDCEFTIDHKIYNTIRCREIHTFRPFAKNGTGAQTITRQTLVLVSEIPVNSTELETIEKRTGLLFDHNATPKPTSGELKAARDLIKMLCRLNVNDVKIAYPNTFSRLIQATRQLSLVALTQIYNRAGSLCSTGRKHMMDALPYLGSNAAVTIMKDAIMGNRVPESTVHEWLFAMSLIPKPNEETLELILPLIYHPKAQNDSQYLLSVSTLFHSYCREHPDCLKDHVVHKFSNYLEKEIDSGCSQTHQKRHVQDKLITILKSLGNTGFHSRTLLVKLNKCVENEELGMDIRVAAIQSYRRMPCSFGRSYLLDIFRNSTFDTEVRIASYIEVMRCPNYFIINTIRAVLEEEEVNQVGSYVWSHLLNLLKSSMPTKVEIQSLITDKHLGEKFNLDRRKFSRNYDYSVFFDQYNVGGNIESNIIFSPKSYIPRSGSLNMTVDLFGESVNIFELSTRHEGFEHLLEFVFGPKGPFSASEVNKRMEKVRLTRSIDSADDNDSVIRQAENMPNVINSNFKMPKFTFGLKMFGNEFLYKSIIGHSEFSTLLDKANPETRIKQLLSGREFKFEKAGLFFDADYAVPTGVGFPVMLTALGTGAVHLSMVGNVRSLELLSLDVEGKFRPSAAIDVTGQMSVDAYHASTGIKLKTSLYSSTAIEGQVKVNGAMSAKVSFKLPQEKVEIITAQSELVVMKGEKEEPQAGITENRISDKTCSWPALDQALGLKLCLDFAFPNASHILKGTPLPKNSSVPERPRVWPSLVLSGPGRFALALYKADPTANEYVLQYDWHQQQNISTISLKFDTPNSRLHRELSAQLILDKVHRNLTILLRGTNNTFEAHGKYKYTPTEKYLDVSLDVNGQKKFIAQIGLRRKDVNNGFVYQPKLYVAVNGERIVELSGVVRVVEKNEINHCSIDLEFKTKKVSMELSGYVRRGVTSFSSNLTLSYQFSTKEYVVLATKLVNKSSQNLIHFLGDLSVRTTAYKHLNFESSLNFQRAQGHAECKIEVTTEPNFKDDAHKFTIKLVFSLGKSHDRTKLHTYIEITKPSKEIDIKFEFKTDISHNGLDDKSTSKLLLRHATGREILTTLDLSFPRSDVLRLDMNLNVTITFSSFVPMIFTLKIDEKKHHEYDIEAAGTWFSGHNMTAKGYYTDKSEGVVSNHNLKLFMTSPSFSEISVAGRLLMDDTQFKLDVQADQENDKYALVLKRAVNSPKEMELYGEIRYKSSLYSVGTIINLMKKRQVLIELHLDHHRDIHIALSSVNTANHKEGGVEIKWDANRDPSQKFEAVARFLHPRALNYSADFAIHYPGRNINGMVLFAIFGTNFDSGFRLEWSPADIIDVKLGAVYQNLHGKSLKVTSQLLTPFPGWKRTSFIGGVLRQDNLLRMNGSVWWQDNQTVSLDIYGDYAFKYEKKEIPSDDDYSDFGMFLYADIPELWIEFNASLVSTVPEVKPMSAAFFHKQNHNKFDTVVHLKGQMNNETVLVRFDSSWELDQSPNSTDVVGTIHLVSPYQGFERGKLVGRLHFTTDYDIQGMAELDLDRRKYTASINGYVRTIRENMLVIEMDTPIANYSRISGRLGYSESKRYLTCLWESPSNSIGFEILLDFKSTSDFDLLFLVATPLDFFSKLLLHGKLKAQMADFRIGFNNLLLGFEGFWRYENIFDLDYKYTLYTPLDGFKENGLVARIIYNKNVDVELRLKVADVKIGALVLCGRKSRTLIADDEDLLKWEGKVELDTYFYPTIKGDLDIDETENVYTIDGNLMLPNGTIKLYDLLNFEDVFTITNDLHINTTFSSLAEIKSEFKWLIYLGESYFVAFDVDALTNSVRKKGKIMVNYTVEAPESDPYLEEEVPVTGPVTRRIEVNLITPWEAFQLFVAKGMLECDESLYKGKLALRTERSTFSGSANIETEEEYLDANVGLEMTTPTFSVPALKLLAKKDFAAAEKSVDITLFFLPPLSKTYHLEGRWQFNLPHLLKIRGKVHTPIEYVKQIEVFTFMHQQPDEKQISIDTRFSYFPNIDVKFSGLKADKSLSFEADTPFEGFRKVSFNGTVVKGVNIEYVLAGKLIADKKLYNVGGVFDNVQYPLSMRVELIPPSEGLRTAHVEILVKRTDTGHELSSHIRHGHQRIDCGGTFDAKPNSYYRVTASITTNHPDFDRLQLSGTLARKENGRVTLHANGITPWTGSDNIQATVSYLKLEKNGNMKGNFTVPNVSGSAECDYTWLFMEHMAFKLKGDYHSIDDSGLLTAEAFYRNPDKSLKYLSLGVDTNVNRSWSCGANATLLLPVVDDVKVAMSLKLPPPMADVHSLVGKLRYANKFAYIAHTLQYTNEVGRAIYGTSGEISNNGSEVQGNLKWEWGNRPNSKSITNAVLYLRNNRSMDFQYNLHTPYYSEDTIFAKVSSVKQDDHYDIKCELYKPKSNKLSAGSVQFSTIYNVNGTINTTTPFQQIPYGATNFKIISRQGGRFRRFVEVLWPNNSAFFDSDYTDEYTNEDVGLVRRLNGKLLVEVPLTTRHVGDVRYGYESKPLEANGYCLADYNKKRMLDGKYKCISTVRAGFDEDVVDMSLENTYFPFGVHYTHQFEYSGGNEGTNLPTIDRKFGEVFHLTNQSSFGLKGNLEVKTTHTGKDIKLKAIHANRTVQIETNYNFLDHRFEHSSWVSLDPNVWTSYELLITNKTTVYWDEEHASLNISYPKRNFTINGFFRSDKKRYEGEITLDWDGPEHPKSIGTSLDWRRVSKKPDQQLLTVCLKHPSFEKDVTFNGTYIRHGSKSFMAKLEATYSPQIQKKFVIESKIQDLSASDSVKYKVDVLAQHPATKLDLLAVAEYFAGNGIYRASSDAKYRRSFLGLQHGTFDGRINANDKEVDFRKSLQKEESYFWAKYFNDEPCCSRLNGSIAKTDTVNYTGDFFIDVVDKVLEISINMTPDATEQFRAAGSIPDSRNAMLNVWRAYEGEIITDIASFLRFNHSRLIISRIQWRPTLQKEVTTGIEQIFTAMLRHFDETVDYWKVYTRSEIKDAIHDIWQNAKPDVQQFLNDLEELKTLEQDFEEFKQFLNESYENNDFYVKDITGAAVTLLDELALKGHIQSLPDIINEIWQIMGNSGGAIRESILWIVETIKTSYLKAVEFIKGLWRGDSAEKITALFENLLQKYDKWVKDLQVTVVRHIEQLWNNFLSMLGQYWDTLVKTIEPTFIQFIHYAETVLWQASNEIIRFSVRKKSRIGRIHLLREVEQFHSGPGQVLQRREGEQHNQQRQEIF
ncbi:UNVERIFIED_CONTAM: hypothetical protein PYX00_008731 [Menopon gallinae]|uniref:Vitellogenin domain-containing protein n=2 Tax=Menopon gallinae TaxID=328185 RepID=A0AAW2HPI0_9NEOP